ncbi:lipase family protein [Flavobacterium sp. JP2137]|uniref:lipase family protein n=1 Tax=Flavobacterium sp. JP2137 TaxID=3414510 RepID=UPI003D2FAB33
MFALGVQTLCAQTLAPGFDSKEYIDLLSLLAQTDENPQREVVAIPESYRLAYKSESMGFDNQWSLWANDNNQAVIAVRGSTQSPISWLSNAYEVMIPAKGRLTLTDKGPVPYQFAVHPAANVHVGWAMGTEFLMPDIRAKIDSCYQKGVRDFYITGHSQGGAISYLLTAALRSAQVSGTLAADIHFKTYASASPKVGNLYFAYEFEKLTQDGWAYNIVNPLDWVAEMPFSIQTTKDFNPLNPFPLMERAIANQGFFKRILFRHYYNQLDKPSKKSQRKMQKLLGKTVFKFIQKERPEIAEPVYVASNHYVRTGINRVLNPQASYFAKFPQNPKNPFINHSYQAYLFLAKE